MEDKHKNMDPEILAAFLSDELSAEDRIRVQQWMDSSPENLKLFQDYQYLFEKSNQLKPLTLNTELAWSKVNARIEAFEAAKAKKIDGKPKNLFSSRWLKVAAAVILPLLALSLYMLLSKTPQQSLLAGNSIQVDTLSDGSVITLNKNSSLTFPEKFDGKSREVAMKGEIFFSIAHDKTKPFIIHAENTLIKVVGTRFNVKSLANSSDIEVIVESGKVLFMVLDESRHDSNSVALEAGDKGIYSKINKSLRKIKAENPNEMFWSTRTLVFKRDKLAEVLKSLQLNYRVKIELENENLAELRFSSSFVDQPIDTVLSIISSTLDLQLVKNKQGYLLKQSNEN